MRVVELVAGLLIVVAMLFDLFQTVLLPRPTPVTFRPSGRILIALYVVWRRIALHFPERREQLLGMFAPSVVVFLLLYWGAGLSAGYGLVLYASTDQIRPPLDVGSALYFSAMALLTFDFGDIVPTGALARVVTIAAGATGLGLFALVITFLFALFAEFQRRELLVITLSARAGAPPSGLALLQTYAKDDMVERLADVFADWEVWSAQVLDSHLSYPILALFRSTHDNQSWLSALGAVLDAATFVLTTIEDVPRGPARLMHRGGLHLVADLAQYFRLEEPQEPYVEESEFDAACTHLRAAGYRLVDQKTAWAAFARARAEYAGALNAMARQWVTPPAEWIGDRSVALRYRDPAPHP